MSDWRQCEFLPSYYLPSPESKQILGRGQHLPYSRRNQLWRNHPQSRRLLLRLSTTSTPTSTPTSKDLSNGPQRRLPIPAPHYPNRLLFTLHSSRNAILRHRKLHCLHHLQLRHPRLLRWRDLLSRLPVPRPIPTHDLLIHILWLRWYRFQPFE